MTKKISATLILATALIFLFIGWTNNALLNTPICTADSEQKRPHITADGNGGAVLVWEDSRNGRDYDIYAQRIDADGNSLWRRGGTSVCRAVGPQRFPQVTADSNGGFIISWFDRRNGNNNDIYVQRLRPNGVSAWTQDGILLCAAQGDQFDPFPVSDNQGGAIITWQDRRNGTDYDIYTQKIDQNGKIAWAENGIPVCAVPEDQDSHRCVADGDGGVVISWQDRRNRKDYDLYTQRIDSLGRVQWGNNGTILCKADQDQRLPQMVNSGLNSILFTWQDKRNGTDYDIYAQSMNLNGAPQWTVNGVVVCKVTNNQYEPRLAADGKGGMVVTWQDYRKGADCNFNAFDEASNHKADVCSEKQLNDWNIYAQRIDASGKPLWAENGITISTAATDQYKPLPISDGSGGTIITWRAADKEHDHNIYAQRLNDKGAVLWTKTGLPVSTAPGNQMDPLSVPDGAGGAIVTWYDKRGGNNFDIYVQRVCAVGKIGACGKAVALK